MNFKQNVDVVLGAQYGDEGKGMVAKLLADRAEQKGEPYAWTSRTGAQNAEHRFIHTGTTGSASDFCGRILPSASCFRADILAVLGAGHCFIPEHLLRECVHFGLPLERLFVDPHAMWLREDHASANLAIGNERGTTGWGIGAAIAEKVRRKPSTQLIGDCELLQRQLPGHITDVPGLLHQIPGGGLMEGSQGALLSLNHGHYPFCTAKDVTTTAMLAELGIGHKRVRKVYGVARLVMMRVPGPSGPTEGKELTYDEVEQRTGLRLPHHTRLQGDTTRWKASNRPDQADEERLFELSLEGLRRSHYLNNYDALAITFTDYHREGNYRVTDWSQLHEDTRALINQISREIAPVFLVRTGRGERDNIWLDESIRVTVSANTESYVESLERAARGVASMSRAMAVQASGLPRAELNDHD
jgi:adenylosuccinate synthase